MVQREADRFGLTLAANPVEDDDYFGAKIDMKLPVIAAGGLATADDVAAVIHAGAAAAMVGTVVLRADESGASATHRRR